MTKRELRLLEDELDGEYGASEEQRAAAKEDSRVGSAVRELLEGEGHVPSLTSDITLRPYESATDLRSRIVDALVSRARRRASRIVVEDDHGRVSLRGTVASTREEEVAVDVAERAIGVGVVEDLLEVRVPCECR